MGVDLADSTETTASSYDSYRSTPACTIVLLIFCSETGGTKKITLDSNTLPKWVTFVLPKLDGSGCTAL